MPWREARPEDGRRAWQSGCSLWTGYVNPRGHAYARRGGRSMLAARAYWMDENGPVPDGMVIGSLCGEPLCIRFSHHEPMTYSEIAYRYGQTRMNHKQRIRAWMLHRSGVSNRRIGHLLNVDESVIRDVLATGYEPIKEDRQ
jgi:hypothetical protein